MKDEQLSEHFWLSEFLASQTAERLGIPNEPDEEQLANLRMNAGYMEAVRALLGSPLIISSGLRVLAVNRALKSPDTSAHVRGLATDFICPAFGSPAKVCREIAASVLQFDQVINEKTWAHIAWPPIGTSPRRDVLTLLKGGGYAAGIQGD